MLMFTFGMKFPLMKDYHFYISRYQHLYNNEYSSQPNDAYFKQFGTSAR